MTDFTAHEFTPPDGSKHHDVVTEHETVAAFKKRQLPAGKPDRASRVRGTSLGS